MMNNPEAAFERWALNMPRSVLGGLLKEYIAESNHTSWDGFSKRDLTGIRNMLTDMMAYYNYYGGDAATELGSEINNVNPVP
jgi:hypothetical protein